jgi:hypothetical protein
VAGIGGLSEPQRVDGSFGRIVQNPGAGPAPVFQSNVLSSRDHRVFTAPDAARVPANTLHAGRNVITVRIQNTRAEGGFVGTADAVYLESGTTRTPLAGT